MQSDKYEKKSSPHYSVVELLIQKSLHQLFIMTDIALLWISVSRSLPFAVFIFFSWRWNVTSRIYVRKNIAFLVIDLYSLMICTCTNCKLTQCITLIMLIYIKMISTVNFTLGCLLALQLLTYMYKDYIWINIIRTLHCLCWRAAFL